MSSATLLDDGLLLLLLRRNLPSAVAPELICSTTGYWFRLARATALPGGQGRFSRATAELDPRERDALRAKIELLDTIITIADVRQLIPAMARLASTYTLNLLSAEVLAVARALDARIVVTHGNAGPRLVAAAQAIGVELTELAA